MESHRASGRANEGHRLDALYGYEILDSRPEQAFDRIARLAARLAGTGMAAIMFFDIDRHWIKSGFGWPPGDNRRAAMAARALLAGNVVVVNDTADDEQLRDHPLVKGEPRIRFYAAAPLRTVDGLSLGALCVADRERRAEFDPATLAMLSDLAGMVMSELELRREALQRRAAEQEVRTIAHVVPAQIAFIDREFRYGFVNEPYAAWFGRRSADIVGRRIDEIAGEQAFRVAAPHLERALTGDFVRYENTLPRADGTLRSVLVNCQPRQIKGAIEGVCLVAIDITERKEHEEKLRLLNAELDHRLKNTLAIVRVLLEQASARDLTKEEVVRNVTHRLDQLAHAHSLLTETQAGGIELRYILECLLAPYRDDRQGMIVCDGPKLLLGPHVALALTSAVQELITNSNKFGALSASTGGIAVRWRLTNGHGAAVHLDWKEKGGPAVRAPRGMGYGLSAVERLLPYEMGARSIVHFEPDGLRWKLDAPLARLGGGIKRAVPAPEVTPQPPQVDQAGTETPSLEGLRVLIAEDSAHIAFSLEASLKAAGANVIGPVATVAEARRLAAGQHIDWAVIDINLGDELSFPLIDDFRQAGIRVIISTGYDLKRQFPGRVSDVPVLTKPFTTQQLLRLIAAQHVGPRDCSGTGQRRRTS